MARGGKRKGAGRKPTIGREDRLEIGYWCAERRRELHREALENTTQRDLADVYEQLKLLPDDGDPLRKDPEDWLQDPDGYVEHTKDMDDAVRRAKRLKNTEQVTRGFRFEQRRLKGIRPLIVAEAQRHFDPKFGGLSPRAVKACWTEWNRFEQDMREATKDYVPDPDNAHFDTEVEDTV